MERELPRAELGDPLILGVGPGGERAAALTARALKLTYPVYGDPTGAVYERFGYGTVLGIIQQSGTIVVDRAGIVRLAHRSANPTTALPVPEVRAVLA